MKAPENFEKIVDRKRYSTQSATLLAHDAYWDGSNFERRGRNAFLYRTARGSYFVVWLTQWNTEADDLTPVMQQEAIELYEGRLREHCVPYEEAFPDVIVEEA